MVGLVNILVPILMRYLAPAALLALALSTQAPAQTTCTGLCMQQTQCPGNPGATTISGVVYAPNGIDPLPNVTVYIPNAPVDPFTAGVTCPVVGAAPSGSPLVGATTGVDGSFQLTNVPVGVNIPLVIISGRWRRQVVIPVTTACTDTPVDPALTHFPTSSLEGDIPKIAIATGSADSVECVLRKIGIKDTEFTDLGGIGRITIFKGSNSPGTHISAATADETTLMENATLLNSYDVLMLPCEGTSASHTGNALLASQLTNLVAFANAGGRVYASHYSYTWMYNNPPFNTVANWFGQSKAQLTSGTATVDTTFTEGQTLAQWLQIVNATTIKGQMALNVIRHDVAGVNKPTQSWLALNTPLDGDAKPIMQFVFDTPVGNATNQCGRVLFNEYHVEDGSNTNSASLTFPAECSISTGMTAQEKLLEFSLFELTNDGSAATLTPTSQDFGSQAINFTSNPKTFTWTNNSTFPEGVTLLNASGDFAISSSSCSTVAPGASCNINVTFTPAALGPRTGTLSVGSGAQTLTASLTGTGVPALVASPTSLNYGSVDVGGTASQNIVVTNTAPAGVPLPALATTGDYAVTATNCPAIVPANSACTVTVTFAPTTTGTRPGTFDATGTHANSGLAVSLTGNGVDFTLSISPTSGTVIAGDLISTSGTLTPLAGFSGAVSVTCSTPAPGSACDFSVGYGILSSPVTGTVHITTTSKYVVVGYGGLIGNRLLALFALLSAALLWWKRRTTGTFVRTGLAICLLTCTTFLASGCTSKTPALNAVYTGPGTYTYTVRATDGTIVHTATYSLTVTAH